MLKRHRFASHAGPAEAPFHEMNTTPLIDVMLVLLIMFIITIPMSTHKVPLDLPQGAPLVRVEPVVHRLTLDASGALRLDGASISEGELSARLAAIAREEGAELQLQTHGEAPYDRFDRVLAAIKRAGISRMGLVGNERFAAAIG